MNECTPALKSRLTLLPFPSGAVYLKPNKCLYDARNCVFAVACLPSILLPHPDGWETCGWHPSPVRMVLWRGGVSLAVWMMERREGGSASGMFWVSWGAWDRLGIWCKWFGGRKLWASFPDSPPNEYSWHIPCTHLVHTTGYFWYCRELEILILSF